MDRHRKRELEELNTRAWNGDTDVFPTQESLDSNLKKNTAFIKRLRTAINTAGVPTFLQEIRTLSLHKYLTEVVSACFEGLCKLKVAGEVAAGVEVVSALHQRFGPEDFTCYLGWLIGRSLSTPDKTQLKALTHDLREREEKERIGRQRILLRVSTELWLVGVLKSLEDVTTPEEAGRPGKAGELAPKPKINGHRPSAEDAEPFPLEVLKDMLSHDREHVNLPLVVLFVKTFAWDILGSRTAKSEGRRLVAEDGASTALNGGLDSATTTDDEEAPEADTPLTSPVLQQRFKNVISRYFDDVKAHMIRDQKQLAAQSSRNAEAYVKSGEVFEDRETKHERALKAQEKLVSSAQTLADALGEEMPDLSEKEVTANVFEIGIGLVKTGEYLRGQAEGAGIWEDEEERRFYEHLVELKDRVPGILLEDGRRKRADGDEQVGKKVEDFEKSDAKAAENEDISTTIANKTVGAQVDALLARLHELTNKDQVDQLAIDFCFLNSKASRNRLVKAIEEIPKGRTDLLPLYARLIATLGKYLTDVPQAMINYLDEEFRSLQRRKSKEFLGQVRMMNIRYIAELTRFGVVPEHVIFHCLKVSLDDFSRMNIEIIASLLENCGRYLLRNPDTSPRMSTFLETLQRKKAAQHLGQQERMLLENAMYYVNPPERAAIQQKDRTTLDLFIRKLVYLDLNKKTLERVIKQIRKLHWEEPEVTEYLRKIFVKPGKIKFSNIHLLAVMLGALHRFHMDFTISVMDEVLERITVGLEVNDFKYNQRRIAEVKYLGELYTYRLVDSTLIFDTLYKLLNYGHDSYAQAGKLSSIDLPDDYFRIRLVCSLLETCGIYFEKGAVKMKLDFFLTFFQYYISVKDPLPMDVEFVVQDTYSMLRPQWKLILNDLGVATEAFAVACKQNYQNAAMAKSAEQEEREEPDGELLGSDEIGPDGEPAAVHGDAIDIKSGEDETADGANGDDLSDDSDDEHIVVTRPEDQRDPQAEAEFDRELAKMMAESVESRRLDRKTLFDVPLPMRRTARDASNTAAEESGGDSRPQTPVRDPGMMKFALLSKKGNRQQTRSIDLPSDSHFAVAMRSQQQAERAEQQRIKSLVLNYDLAEDQHDGEEPAFHYVQSPNSKRTRLVGKGTLNRSLKPKPGLAQQQTGRAIEGAKLPSSSPDSGYSSPPFIPPVAASARKLDLHANRQEAFDIPNGAPRLDKSGNSRSKQRARKLQLGDIDWYGNRSNPVPAAGPPLAQASLNDYIVNKGSMRGGGDSQQRRSKMPG